MLIRLRILLLSACLLIVHTGYAQDKHLSVAILSVDPVQMGVYADLFDAFQDTHPQFTIKVDFYSDSRYKQHIDNWLEQGTYDLLYWQGGRRLSSLIQADLIAPVEALVDKTRLQNSYQSGSLRAVSYDDTIYALPVAHYAWGVYYNKNIFNRLGLSEPTDWPAFVRLCAQLKSKGVYPLIQAKHDYWPLLGWLDYLSLEAGGMQLRDVLVSDQSMTIEQASAISRLLKPVWEQDYLFARDFDWEWSQTIPAVVREQAAMTFMGQFAESVVSPEFSDTLGYFPFPVSEPQNRQIQVAPLDVWIVPNSSNNKQSTAQLLSYLAAIDNHHRLAIDLGFLPVSKRTAEQDIRSQRLNQGLAQLQSSEVHIQYFDRDAPEGYAISLAKAMHQSIVKQNMLPLEQALIARKVSAPTVRDFEASEKTQLTFATIAGINTTFDISARLRKVYDPMGVDISIRRFSDLTQLSKQEVAQLDGELARPKDAILLSDDFLRIEEPVWNVKGYLVCKDADVCQNWLAGSLKTERVGHTVKAPRVYAWFEQSGVNGKAFRYSHKMIDEFLSGDIEVMLMLSEQLLEFQSRLEGFSQIQMFDWPVYHFIHKRHKAMIKPVTAHLQQLKKANLREQAVSKAAN